MDSSTLLILISICGAIFYFWRKGRTADPRAETGDASLPPAPLTASLRPVSPEEAEVQRAKVALDKRNAERTEEYQVHKSTLHEAEQRLAKASEYVKTSGLDLAVPYLWEEMRHWPAWLVNQEGRWKCPVPVTDVAGDESNSYRQGRVQWRWDDQMLAISFNRQTNYEPSGDDLEFADFTVKENEREVLKITCCRNGSKEFDRWRFVNVNALSVGPWMATLMDYFGVLRNTKEAESNQRNAKYIQDRADLVDLGGV